MPFVGGMPSLFELHRTHVAQRRMNSAMVVEAQPVDDLVHGRPACFEPKSIEPAHFERSPEAFRGRIVPTIAFATHRAAHAVFSQRLLEVGTAVLAAAIAVEDHTCCGLAPEPGHA